MSFHVFCFPFLLFMRLFWLLYPASLILGSETDTLAFSTRFTWY